MSDFCKGAQDRGIAEVVAKLCSICTAATGLTCGNATGGLAMKYIATLKNLIREDFGQDLIEYALLRL